MKRANTIDEVISILDEIILAEIAAESNLAFFPVLYKKVTERIKKGIANLEFENTVRMEKLDVIFANRYIEAYFAYKSNQKTTQSWNRAFKAAKEGKYIVIQHLFLGINAHINLDLGIAVCETVGKDGEMMDFENDFNKINEILASMVDAVQGCIGNISPMFFLLEKIGKGREDKIVNFSINIARDGAWLFANQYHISKNQPEDLSFRDGKIALLAEKLTTSKSWLVRTVIKTIRFFETKNVSKVVKMMDFEV